MKMLWVEPSPVCRALPRITTSVEGLLVPAVQPWIGSLW